MIVANVFIVMFISFCNLKETIKTPTQRTLLQHHNEMIFFKQISSNRGGHIHKTWLCSKTRFVVERTLLKVKEGRGIEG